MESSPSRRDAASLEREIHAELDARRGECLDPDRLAQLAGRGWLTLARMVWADCFSSADAQRYSVMSVTSAVVIVAPGVDPLAVAATAGLTDAALASAGVRRPSAPEALVAES